MIACPECGRPLEPFKIKSGDESWIHTPHCWHPDTEEVYGIEMTLERAKELATWAVEAAELDVEEALNVLEELNSL